MPTDQGKGEEQVTLPFIRVAPLLLFKYWIQREERERDREGEGRRERGRERTEGGGEQERRETRCNW